MFTRGKMTAKRFFVSSCNFGDKTFYFHENQFSLYQPGHALSREVGLRAPKAQGAHGEREAGSAAQRLCDWILNELFCGDTAGTGTIAGQPSALLTCLTF